MAPHFVIATVAAYLAVLFLVARIAGRRAGNAAFFIGNRSTPWYLAAFAMIGAAMSGVTFISVPGSVAADSFSYMQMVAGFTVGQLLTAFVLVPIFYRLRVVSLYEYLDLRFGLRAHRTGAWFFFFSKMTGAALKVYVVCAVLQLLVFDCYGLPLWTNVVVTVGCVWLYTRRGGVRSLIWTDTLQSLCLVGSLVALTLFVARALGLSAAGVWHEVASSPLSRVFFFDDPSSERYFWKMFFSGIVLLVAMTGLDQDMMQRNMSCPTPRDAQKNIVVTAVCQIFVIYLFLMLGVLLYTYMERRGIALPAKSDQVFPLVAVGGGLPVAAGVLFIIGFVSSAYSAAGASLTALTTSFTIDILHGARRYDDRRLGSVRRRVHLLMAVGMAFLVLAFGYWASDSVINLVFKVAGYTYGPILGLFLFGICTRRRVCDRLVPAVAVAAPLASVALQLLCRTLWGYGIGFELLAYNAAFTVAGLFLISKRYEK